MYKLGFLSLNWPWFVLVIALIVSIIATRRLTVRTWGVLATAVVLYLGVFWHMWTWVSLVFWIAVVIGLVGVVLLQWRTHPWASRLASVGSRVTLAIGVLLLIVTTIGALNSGHANYGWVLTALVVGAFLTTLAWLLLRLTGKAALAVVACLVAAMIVVAGSWSISASRHRNTPLAGPTTTVTPSVTPTPAVTVTVTPTPTSSPVPTVTTTKVVPRTRTVPPSTTVSTVVVSAPKVNVPRAKTSTTSRPKPSPTKAKPKPAKPVIVNVTTLSSVNVHDEPGAPNSSPNFCATANMPNHDQGVLLFQSKYGSFTEGMFSGSDIGQVCTTYVAPSIVPPGGTDTITVTLRDMNTGQSAVPNVQTFKIQNSVHP